MKKKYLIIEEDLLDKCNSLLQASIISYLKRFQDNNQFCFQSKKQLANYFKTSESTIKRELKELEKLQLVFSSNDRKYLIAFNNRKALVLVDEDNPFPMSKISSNELKPIKQEYIPEEELNVLNLLPDKFQQFNY